MNLQPGALAHSAERDGEVAQVARGHASGSFVSASGTETPGTTVAGLPLRIYQGLMVLRSIK